MTTKSQVMVRGAQNVMSSSKERHIQLSTKHSDETKSSKPRTRRHYRHQDSSTIDKDTESKKKRNTKKPDGPIACEQNQQQSSMPASDLQPEQNDIHIENKSVIQ